MVGVEAALEIRVLHRHGKGIREIARETGSRAQHSAALSARRRGGALQASSASVDDPWPASPIEWARRRRSAYRQVCC